MDLLALTWSWYDNSMRRTIVITCLLVLYPCLLAAVQDPLVTEPFIVFISPLGGQQGTTQKIEIHGNILDNASAVVFETTGISAQIEKTETVSECCFAISTEAEDESISVRLLVNVEIGSTVQPGNHWLRVVTPKGVTNPLLFRVNADPVIEESEETHSTPERAQPIDYPVVINGKIDKPGEVDFYQVDLPTPCELSLEIRPSHAALAQKFRPDVGVFAKRPSFLNPDHLARLAFADTEKTQGEKVIMNFDPREREGTQINLNYPVPSPGQYFLRVGSLRGDSALDFVYQFRVALSDQPKAVEVSRERWQERSFTRKLDSHRLDDLWNRSVRLVVAPGPENKSTDPEPASEESQAEGETSAPVPAEDIHIAEIGEQEPNGEFNEAVTVPVPGIAHGVIDEPTDVDIFRFQVNDGQKLAFEVETPHATIPEFNPVVAVLDASGNEVITNLQKTEKYSSAQSPHLIAISPKITSTFEKGGDFFIRVKEVTTRNGKPNFAYRVLIRPQIPHVGDTFIETRTLGPQDGRVDPHRINLVAGQARKISLILNHEEGLFIPSNQIGISFEGLPKGVQLLVGSSSYQGPNLFNPANINDSKSHRGITEKVTAVLYADNDAATTTLPSWVTVSARPVVDGFTAEKLPIQKIPLMVLPASSVTADKSDG